MDCRTVWAAVSDIVLQREDLSQQRRAFFRLTSLRAIVDDTAVLEVPDAYTAQQVETKLREHIVDALGRHLGRSVDIVLMLPDGSPIQPTPADPVGKSSHGLNPEYTFLTFVLGMCNRFAHAAAYAVADAPAKAYNPLVIVGAPAVMRTHLLHAIGHAALELGTARSVLCVPAGEFPRDVTDRRLDILLVEGFPWRDSPQRTGEFLDTIATLYRAGTQVALTVDCEPEDLATLRDLVRARFERGLVAVINCRADAGGEAGGAAGPR